MEVDFLEGLSNKVNENDLSKLITYLLVTGVVLVVSYLFPLWFYHKLEQNAFGSNKLLLAANTPFNIVQNLLFNEYLTMLQFVEWQCCVLLDKDIVDTLTCGSGVRGGTSMYRLHRYMLPDRVLLLRRPLNRVSLLPLLALCSRFDPYKTRYLNCSEYQLKLNCVNVQL